MYTARAVWIVEALVSLGLMALIGSRLSSDEASAFLLAELAILTVSFLLTLFVGPGKVLALGAGLAFGLATLMAASASGCGESDFICLGPDVVFALGLMVAGALYPGWALGAGVGALARLHRQEAT